MAVPILATKLYIPPPRPGAVVRARLIERLNDGLSRKITLISAPAGFGKTTLVSAWVAQCSRQVAWLSLDNGDNDPTRFLTYLVAALRTVTGIGEGVLSVLGSPQPPPIDSLLTPLLNEIASIPHDIVLVLDDYHVLASSDALHSSAVDDALAFLIEHLPPRMHMVIATREDPRLPLARLRARGQLTELRVNDLRFTPSEAADFLNDAMGLTLSPDNIAALESRTEGWIAGLQLAALALQGLGTRPERQNASQLIESFTGSHHFVLDYLVEEVLNQQPENVQTFLLYTSILDRMCGALCDAVLLDESASGQRTLESIERANLFIVPLDSERRWYRYHHLFTDLLRQRLKQHLTQRDAALIQTLHTRASIWYEENGLELEAFHHAAAAGDIARAERLMEGSGMPLLFRGAITPMLNWLESLPKAVLDSRPSLWVMYAFAWMSMGQPTGVEPKLQAAEAALQNSGANDSAPDAETQDIMGRIAAIRAMMAIPENQVETMLAQARRALDLLHPDNLPMRTATTWALGFAYQMRGDRAAAKTAYSEALPISEATGNIMFNIAATSSLGSLQEADNQYDLAVAAYRRVLELAGDPPLPHANGAYLGLAQIHYEWNDLEAAQHYGQIGLELAQHIKSIDVPASAGVILARVKLAQGDAAGASRFLDEADAFVRQHGFVYRIPELVSARVRLLLHHGNIQAAARLVRDHDAPIAQACVHIAEGNPAAALALLEPLRREAASKAWGDDLLRVLVLETVAHHADGDTEAALKRLNEALTLAEPGGIIRTFIDEGTPMAHILSEASARGIRPAYVHKLLTTFEDEARKPAHQPLIDALTERELEVLRLVALGLTNHEISQRLFLALDTVKGHNRRIYSKLQVQRRTEAVARARELGLL